MILFFDTETTGKANFTLPSSAACQPRLVQLGAILTSDDGAGVFHEVNLIVRPVDFKISKEVSDIHGITQEIAMESGIPISAVMAVFVGLARNAKMLVAFNSQFDQIVMEHELHLMGKKTVIPEIFGADRQLHCAMKACTDILKIPGPYGFKWPRLAEAYRFFFKDEMADAHDALADVRGTVKVHFATQKHLQTQENKPNATD